MAPFAGCPLARRSAHARAAYPDPPELVDVPSTESVPEKCAKVSRLAKFFFLSVRAHGPRVRTWKIYACDLVWLFSGYAILES